MQIKVSGNFTETFLPFYVSLGNGNVYNDNAPIHRAKIVTDWKNENLIIFFHGQPRVCMGLFVHDPRPKSTNELILALQKSRSKNLEEI